MQFATGRTTGADAAARGRSEILFGKASIGFSFPELTCPGRAYYAAIPQTRPRRFLSHGGTKTGLFNSQTDCFSIQTI